MSKHLFKRIALMSRQRKELALNTLLEVLDYLNRLQVQVVVESETAQMLEQSQVFSCSSSELAQHSDLLLVIGGDGSLLHAAHIATHQNLPVLGINRGHLGFLTDIYPNELSKIEQVLKGNFISEERFLLESSIPEQKPSVKHAALNDIVLTRHTNQRMLEFEIYIDQQFVCKQRADGLIIATPTGSTAYALSGGGPIIHPGLQAHVLVPMFSHSLSSRPIVIDANSSIDLIFISKHSNPILIHDGRTQLDISFEDSVHIQKQALALRLIHPSDYHYFASLRSKLYWEH